MANFAIREISSSFPSMVKSYEKELPTLTSIHHIRGSYQEDPRKKKEGWKSEN